MSTDELQNYYMMNESCFQVDEDDNIIGVLSKFQSHRVDPVTLKVPLHRAFSVFLLKPVAAGYELLLQRRSAQKLTFPQLWANSCCSHPIGGLGEDTADVVTGVVKAARRKLFHELGIPLDITEKRCFYHYSRIHYYANQDPWGEHEIDHILLMEADPELVESIKYNDNEVLAVKFVPIEQLKHLDQSELTPWLRKILKSNLLNEWIEDFDGEIKTSHREIKTFAPSNSVHKTKYSSQPIIKLP